MKAAENSPLQPRLTHGCRRCRVAVRRYTDYVMSWVDKQLSNESMFPTGDNQKFPDDFMKRVKAINKRLFRLFAIM